VAIELVYALQKCLVLQRSNGCRLCQAIDIERLTYPIEQIRKPWLCQAETNAQTCKTIGLGQGARHNQVGETFDQSGAIETQFWIQVFVVSLVKQDCYALTVGIPHFFEERGDLLSRLISTGWIVWV